MIKTLRRGLKSFGRSSRKAAMKVDAHVEPDHDDPPRPSDAFHMITLCYGDNQSIGYSDGHSSDLESKCYYSDSSLFPGWFEHSSSAMSSPRRIQPAERSDPFLLPENQHDVVRAFSSACSSSNWDFRDPDAPGSISEAALDHIDAAEDLNLIIPGWPLQRNSIGFDTTVPFDFQSPPVYPAFSENVRPQTPEHSPSADESKPSNPSCSLEATVSKVKPPPRSPLRRMFSDLKKSFPNQIDRHVSIFDWASRLPSRSKDPSKPSTSTTSFSQDSCTKILQAIAKDAFRVGCNDQEIMEELTLPLSSMAGDSEPGSSELVAMTRSMETVPQEVTNKAMILAEKLESLCAGRKCTKFSYEELAAGTSNFSPSNVVGRGGGSEVYEGKLQDGRSVAVKRLNRGPLADEELLNDVSINTTLLSHPHIVSLFGYCVDESHLMLVYDYLQEGNLEDRLRAGPMQKSSVLPWRVRHKVAVGTAKALDCLHHGTSCPVIHRDVKSSNILLTSDFEAQLSDFGLAKWAPLNASHLLCDDIFGTFGYLAPEYFMYGRVNNKTDVYAFGVVLLELITGQPPINSNNKGQENLVNWARPLLKENDLEKLVDSRLEGAYDVDQMNKMLHAASLCIQQSPRRRPQMSRVLQILCSSNGIFPSIRSRSSSDESSEIEEVVVDSEDFNDDFGEMMNTEEETSGSCNELRTGTDVVRTHLALAMLGVDDNLLISRTSSSLDHTSGLELLHLDGRFRLSSGSLVQ